MQTLTLDQLKLNISRLEYSEQLDLLLAIVSMLKTQSNSQATVSLLQLDGLGKDIWASVKTDDYIQELRNEWE
ncbi:MAG: hypothetical protein NW226_10875 [Microscillaceae bacterium]|nr:hypothetical protein [Microscillaceae bacterium]